MSDRSIIYTAIAGGYDNLKPPRNDVHPGRPEVDLQEQDGSLRIAFLDNPDLCAVTRCPGWQIEPMASSCMDPLMQAKRYKVLAHEVLPPGAEFSLWVDGSIEVGVDLHPEVLALRYLKEVDLALFRHAHRNCLYDEARACQLRRLDDSMVMARQMNRYRAEGYPRNNGLAECCVILRRHTSAVTKLNELWWREINNGSRRDQLSFNYACWKLGLKYSLLPGIISQKGVPGNPFFRKRHHAKPR
jgi:Protein of unknown function (DUF616).